MANFNVRVPDDLAAGFDAWAGSHGGRSPALRRLIDQAVAADAGAGVVPGRLPVRPVRLTVRLTGEDGQGLATAAASMGLTPSAWAAALVRRRLHDRPAFGPTGDVAVLAIQTELRRIGVNVNQIARAFNVAVLEGRVLSLEVAYLEDLRTDLRAHMFTLRQALTGNLAYWQVGP